ncbi:MAG: methyl-accepting chemotaxis protein [Treponema sp.]|nr:methyl-accepting chemotaxis protein [Treponema sp.]
MKKMFGKIGLQAKIVGLATMVVVMAILVTQIMATFGMRKLSIDTALIMGARALNGYVSLLESRMAQVHGRLRLIGNQLVDEWGGSISSDFRIPDEVSRALGTEVTIFAREGNDFLRISTSITDAQGNRVVGTWLGPDNAALEPLLAGESFHDRVRILGVEHFAFYRPIFADNRRDVIGILSVATEMATIHALIEDGIRFQLLETIITSLVMIVLAIVLLIVSCRIMLIRPISHAVSMLKEISEGEGDLTRELAVDSDDEVGKMAHYFNMTLERIKSMVVNIRAQTLSLSEIGNELASNMTQTAAAVNQIAVNTQGIKGRVLSQSASVTQTNATMEQVTVNIDRLNAHVEKQANAVSMSSAAIEEMIANIQSVTHTLAMNSQSVKELENASEIGRMGLSDVAADIQGISRESESLLEINSVMENIASQTNLLSMNAAIEAAHAGDSGRGFAVVADEIRKLAESSGAQSKTISDVLKNIKGSIDKILLSTNNVLHKFEAIDSGVKTVAEQENLILCAMEEQGHGSKQVLQSIGQVSDITEQVKGGSRQMLEGSREVIHEGRNLQRVTQEITGGMNDMAVGTDEINAAIARINELSARNSENIRALLLEVSRFKVE